VSVEPDLSSTDLIKHKTFFTVKNFSDAEINFCVELLGYPFIHKKRKGDHRKFEFDTESM
jgi:hypothetical protein